MRKTTLTLLTAASAAALVATTAPAFAAHEELVVTGLTQNDKLVTFVAGTGERLSQVKITGIAEGQRLAGIDYRPATGGLYGLAVNGTAGFLYLIDDETGAAKAVGTTGVPVSGAVSIDFNPTVDRLRVVSTDNDNLRINPNTGARADVPMNDGRLAYTDGTTTDPDVVGAAYINNDNDPATGTTLYDVDGAHDTLVKQTPANAGSLQRVGTGLGIDVDSATGFDVYSELDSAGVTRNIALLSTRTADGTLVYTVNLAAGTVNKTATSGVRAQGAPVVDIAVDPRQ